jgi:hypothetical protein
MFGSTPGGHLVALSNAEGLTEVLIAYEKGVFVRRPHDATSWSKALACFKSSVSKPSVNQP